MLHHKKGIRVGELVRGQLVKVEHRSARVELLRARTGRPRPSQSFAPQDVVRLEIRLPAAAAAQVYAAAAARNQSVNHLVAGLLTAALSAGEAPTPR